LGKKKERSGGAGRTDRVSGQERRGSPVVLRRAGRRRRRRRAAPRLGSAAGGTGAEAGGASVAWRRGRGGSWVRRSLAAARDGGRGPAGLRGWV